MASGLAGLLVFIVIFGIVLLFLGVKVVQQIERGVVFRLGKVQDTARQPGLTFIIPIIDQMRKVNVQVIAAPIPAQEGITRDNVTVTVDAVVYFRVHDAIMATVEVQHYPSAMALLAQTSLRSIIGQSDMDHLLSQRAQLNASLAELLDEAAARWGITIDRVELKDVSLPETMKRSMSRQAEAERERRARVITADGELQASTKLSEAAQVLSNSPAALQLRMMQTIVEVAAEKTSTLVMPFPIELLRYFDAATNAMREKEAGSD